MTVTVSGLILGDGQPKICVPLTGASVGELEDEVSAAKLTADMLEWRADYFDAADDFERVKAAAGQLREIAGETPLLFTFRTKKEGGERDIEIPRYAALNKMISETGYVDLIDVELLTGDGNCRDIADAAHKSGVKVIISNHDFSKTPSAAEMTARIKKMRGLGADIPKIAVMPNSPRDVLELITATCTAAENAGYPIITMSMGKLGAITRLSGACFGSCVTFGTVGRASAPGQLAAADLKRILEILR